MGTGLKHSGFGATALQIRFGEQLWEAASGNCFGEQLWLPFQKKLRNNCSEEQQLSGTALQTTSGSSFQ